MTLLAWLCRSMNALIKKSTSSVDPPEPLPELPQNARDAMEFYKEVFGGDLTVSTFADLHASQEPAEENLVMHAQLESPSGLTLMGSDTPARMDYNPGNTYSVSLSGKTTLNCVATGRNSAKAALFLCRLRWHPGATPSACAPTNS